jgi:hypothetical protein
LDTQRSKPTRKKAWKQVFFIVWILARDQFLVLTKKIKKFNFQVMQHKMLELEIGLKI